MNSSRDIAGDCHIIEAPSTARTAMVDLGERWKRAEAALENVAFIERQLAAARRRHLIRQDLARTINKHRGSLTRMLARADIAASTSAERHTATPSVWVAHIEGRRDSSPPAGRQLIELTRSTLAPNAPSLAA